MSTIQIEVPESVLDEARRLASKDKIPLDYYVALVLTKHIALQQGVDYLKERGKGASRERFLEILAKAPNNPPLPGDEIEP
jgi:hypothetical protein